MSVKKIEIPIIVREAELPQWYQELDCVNNSSGKVIRDPRWDVVTPFIGKQLLERQSYEEIVHEYDVLIEELDSVVDYEISKFIPRHNRRTRTMVTAAPTRETFERLSEEMDVVEENLCIQGLLFMPPVLASFKTPSEADDFITKLNNEKPANAEMILTFDNIYNRGVTRTVG